MDDERIKNLIYIFEEEYFEETFERIRNIRSSERIFYQKITDIYSSHCIDYAELEAENHICIFHKMKKEYKLKHKK